MLQHETEALSVEFRRVSVGYRTHLAHIHVVAIAIQILPWLTT